MEAEPHEGLQLTVCRFVRTQFCGFHGSSVVKKKPTTAMTQTSEFRQTL